jgi:hypothetical protein
MGGAIMICEPDQGESQDRQEYRTEEQIVRNPECAHHR